MENVRGRIQVWQIPAFPRLLQNKSARVAVSRHWVPQPEAEAEAEAEADAVGGGFFLLCLVRQPRARKVHAFCSFVAVSLLTRSCLCNSPYERKVRFVVWSFKGALHEGQAVMRALASRTI